MAGELGGATVLPELRGVSCGRCKGERFRAAINTRTRELLLLCEACNMPNNPGAKLSAEAIAKIRDRGLVTLN